MADFGNLLSQEQLQLLVQIRARLIELGAPGTLLELLNNQGTDGISSFLPSYPDRQLYGLCDRLSKVEAALCQLELGLYGICSDCESEIEMERLVKDPAEQRCAKCAAKSV
ncbi:TraR/DksA family transcriptional regulator [Gallaecimonas mangrovi]|uniref:TraR/DksA family transcriptional regulator n=1 Tax=Gallaecimonas mangrovi TaxID=2291597 RepID=UPI000E20C001|nr:TraR/DksA C4-type zinc finger protein [Gallaecimonas mangrovi]